MTDQRMRPVRATTNGGKPGDAGPRREPAAPADRVVSSVGVHLEDRVADLNEAERTALELLLRQARREPELACLAAQPAESVLNGGEVDVYRALAAEPPPARRVLAPHLTLIMKATRVCNLRCTYCGSRADGPNHVMPFEVLARSIRGALLAPGLRSVELIWHGGEPTLRSRGFYRKALWLQQQFRRPGQRIVNNLQTNGTRLDSEWVDFLVRYRFRVGVSLDGPPEVHDLRRRDAAGEPTSDRVRAGLAQLAASGVPHGVCIVVDDDLIALGPRRLLDHLLELGVGGAGLLSVVPQGGASGSSSGDSYLEFPRYIDFLIRLFHLWWPDHVDRIAFRELSDLMARLRGERGSYCYFQPGCMGTVLTIEPQGGVAGCDKFQGDDGFLFGNVLTGPLTEALASPRLTAARTGTDADAEKTGTCDWTGICHGGCPHDRYTRHRQAMDRDESCCGWEPLISHLAEAVGR